MREVWLLFVQERWQIGVGHYHYGYTIWFCRYIQGSGRGLFWVAPPSKATQQIYAATGKKRKHAYITKRWRLIAWIMRWMPDVVYNR